MAYSGKWIYLRLNVDSFVNSNGIPKNPLITDRFNNPSNYGADTIRLLNDKGSMGRNVDTTMVMNPDNIRSRFAAGDPFRRNAAIAAATGSFAPDLLAEEYANGGEVTADDLILIERRR